MSPPEKRSALLRKVRLSLADLRQEGIEFLGRPLPGAPVERERFDPSSESDPVEGLRLIRENLGECTRCRLHEGRNRIVFGEGNPQAPVVFVGEGPGAEEDRTGRPFVGRAGELLTRIIESVGWQREDVYICNIVKCRPPKNRDPATDEVATCRPFLDRQLLTIRPKVIVTLGKPALSTLLGRNVAITKMRGIWLDWNGIPLLPTYHPAYLLRNYTRETRQAVWDDLRKVRARVDETSGS
ncbi:MAG: uracil-DNA glycosylase [Myxococcales bacterium]|nr:uracil-DNA glycosylase [Myxococcales bacterium]TDI95124.1 MAG: uracil-DNA glycosylase [Deltaproteobacteria bacterium]TDJ07864.1 MAG: uracil-DNA glycosylase [Deltaproteobacteria bacterium]